MSAVVMLLLILALTSAVAVSAAYMHLCWITPPGRPLAERSVALQSLTWLGRWVGGACIIVVSAAIGTDLASTRGSIEVARGFFAVALILGPAVASFTLGPRAGPCGCGPCRAFSPGQPGRRTSCMGGSMGRLEVSTDLSSEQSSSPVARSRSTLDPRSGDMAGPVLRALRRYGCHLRDLDHGRPVTVRQTNGPHRIERCTIHPTGLRCARS